MHSSGVTDPAGRLKGARGQHVSRLRRVISSPAIGGLAWVIALGVALLLAERRYYAAMASTVGYDFRTYYLPAAQSVAAGQSPYEVDGYVYSPLVAILLAPLVDQPWVVGAWIGAMVVFALLACLIGSWAATEGQALLLRAIVFGIAAVTLLTGWPFTVELFLGQSNLLVLLCLSLAMLSTKKDRALSTGLSVGLAAVIKSWPAGLLIWLLRSPARGRLREWGGVAIAATLAIVLALGVGGLPAVLAMMRAPVEASDQQLIAYSVWGAGDLLFTPTGLVSQIAVSTMARWTVTGVLLVLVSALLVLTLRRPGDPLISLLNVTFCVVLLLPVSHYAYLILPLPALWWWTARLIARPRERGTYVAVASLGTWWLVAFRNIPEGEVSSDMTWQAYLLILGSTVVAAATSILVAARIPRAIAEGSLGEQAIVADDPHDRLGHRPAEPSGDVPSQGTLSQNPPPYRPMA